MRKINTGDVFKLARIVTGTNMAKTITEAYQQGKREGADAETIGINTAMELMISCSSSQTEDMFYSLLGGICEKEPYDIETQPFEETVNDIKQIMKENDIIHFFTQASRLAKAIKK